MEFFPALKVGDECFQCCIRIDFFYRCTVMTTKDSM